MVNSPPVLSSNATVESDVYRREARRLRHRLACRPIGLYAALKRLSDRHDRLQQPQKSARVDRSGNRDNVARWFAGQVAATGNGQVLRYSMRLELLKTAQRIGISRFEANLIIAAAEHRRPARSAPDTIPLGRIRSFKVPLLVFLSTQLAIVLALWHLVSG